MNPAAVGLMVLTAAAFPLLLLWAIGRAVTATGERAPYSRSRHYLAGRLDDVRITALIDGGDERWSASPPQPPALPQPTAAHWPRCFASPPASAPWAGSGAGEMRAPCCAPTSAMTAPSCSPNPCSAAMPPANQPPASPGRPPSWPPHRISHHLMAANRPGSAMVPHQRRT